MPNRCLPPRGRHCGFSRRRTKSQSTTHGSSPTGHLFLSPSSRRVPLAMLPRNSFTRSLRARDHPSTPLCGTAGTARSCPWLSRRCSHLKPLSSARWASSLPPHLLLPALAKRTEHLSRESRRGGGPVSPGGLHHSLSQVCVTGLFRACVWVSRAPKLHGGGARGGGSCTRRLRDGRLPYSCRLDQAVHV